MEDNILLKFEIDESKKNTKNNGNSFIYKQTENSNIGKINFY